MTQDFMQYPNLRKHMDRLYVRINELEIEVARLKKRRKPIVIYGRPAELEECRELMRDQKPEQADLEECNCRELAPYRDQWICPVHGYRQECKPLAKFGEH